MILNMTQHAANAEQKAAGTVDLVGREAAELKRLLTFDAPPTKQQIESRADAIAALACAYLRKGRGGATTRGGGTSRACCMIAGAPFLMPALAHAMRSRGLVPVCAFSRRESVEESQEDGSVVKRSVFRHLGFVNLA